jgi:hypothetical protein
MTQRLRNRLIEISMLLALAMATALVMPRANAGMIGTDQATPPAAAGAERERVKALLARPEVAKALEKLGVKAADAVARVDAMSDEEVSQLAGRIDALPVGGVLSNEQLIVILLLVIILVLVL